MDRRKSLKLLGIAALVNCFPAASQSNNEIPIVAGPGADADAIPAATQAVACRVVGVGDAGCNLLLAAWSRGLVQPDGCNTEFGCVTMGQHSTQAVRAANRLHPDIAPIRAVQLSRHGSGGNADVARAKARKHQSALQSLVEDADIVILVAGIGGGTGSTVSPLLASMAMEAGALVLGVIATPFAWEIGRYPNAFKAVQALERSSHYLVSLPNEKMGQLLGVDATLDDVISFQQSLATACIQRLLFDGSRFCTGRPRPGQ
jgi:cell division protein FtsZ